MKIIAYLKSTMRLATALFLSVFALVVVFGLGNCRVLPVAKDTS